MPGVRFDNSKEMVVSRSEDCRARVVCEFAPLPENPVYCICDQEEDLHKNPNMDGSSQTLRNTGIFHIPGFIEVLRRKVMAGHGNAKVARIIQLDSVGPSSFWS